MPDSDPNPADAVLERLDDEITFLVDNLRDISDSLTDLACYLDSSLTRGDSEQVGGAVDRVRVILSTQVTDDLTALVGLGAIRHGTSADLDTVTTERPGPTGDDGTHQGTLRDREAAAAQDLRRLVADVGDHFDLARIAAERGNAQRSMTEYRLARRAAHLTADAYRLWAACLAEPNP
ncbi:hypothetical protein [Micromonospora sp. SH-82]|uniref:hypothetical protein n=1 Tax=Micromonospora sp. SH-82 TaxID=3132938 RepID=UPI003EB89565